MAIVGDYTAQQMRNLILKFYPGSYTPTTLENVTLNWQTRTTYSSMGNIGAAITAVSNGPWQDAAYTYLKYCEEYVIGYSQYGVQILKGKCFYGGIRDLRAEYAIWTKPIYSDTGNLPAFIWGVYATDLPAYIRVWQTSYADLPGSIHGWQVAYLSAYINGMSTVSLPGFINAVPPADLPAYVKAWPQIDLPARLHGWQEGNLLAMLYAIQKGDLPATINVETPANLRARLKGWARGVIANLGAYIDGLTWTDLPTTIRATYLKDLPSYINAVATINLGANIHGYDYLDLMAAYNGVYGSYDLRAYINATNNYKDLLAIVKPRVATEVPGDLPARIRSWNINNLNAYISAIGAANLGATISAIGQVGNLPASITAKTIRLTSILDIITMAHSDLSGTINASCIWSEIKDLPAYINTVYKKDLGAYIRGYKNIEVVANLGASYGYADSYSYIDKLPISISIATETYRYIDKLPLLIKIFTSQYDLGASITGTYLYKDLAAAVSGVYLQPHHFDNTKSKERFFNRTYNSFFESLQLVEISFSKIVEDYFYSSLGGEAWKVNRADKWIADVAAYIPADTAINVKRKLHRIKSLHDISRYESVDEAMRAAIDYVTAYPYDDIPAYINPHGGFLNLRARVSGRGITSTNNNLAATITGQTTGTKVVGKDEGIEIF